MNILHISRTMGQGGAEKVVYQICKDVKYNMFVASTGGIYEDELKKYNVKHYKIPDINGKNPFLMIKTFLALKKIIKKEKIDIVHSHHRMAAFYSRILNIFNKKFKRIYTAHNVFYDKKKLMNFALTKSKIVAVGNGVRNNLIDVYNIDERRIEIIFNSIERPKKLTIPEDDFITKKGDKIYIGTIGRLSEQKGIDVFIKAMSRIIENNNNVYGIIIGNGELMQELVNIVKQNNIEQNILFLGYRNDVLQLIKYLDFVVLSSRWEGFPLTPIEVFSCRKTIIATNIDGNNEIVKDKVNGLLFEKDDVEQLVEKINYLLENGQEKNELENNAYNDFKQKYSYDIFIERYCDLYKILKNSINERK